MTEICSQTHKKHIKTHIEALKIKKKNVGGDPQTPLTKGGTIPLSCSPPLVPLALNGFRRRTTFEYATTALVCVCVCVFFWGGCLYFHIGYS